MTECACGKGLPNRSGVINCEMVTLELDSKTESLLADAARKSGVTQSQFARDAIMEALAEQRGAELALDRLQNPGLRHTLEEVKSELDL